MRSIASLLPLILVASGCGNPAAAPEPQLNLEVGFLTYAEWEARMDLEPRPDGLLDVVVTTVGPGCARVGESVTRTAGDTLEVTPFDYLPSAGYPCPRNIAALRHTVTVDPKVLRVVVVEGRSYPGMESSSMTFPLSGPRR